MRQLRFVSFIRSLLLLSVCAAIAMPMAAQSEHPISINFGGGVTPLVGNVSTRLDNGWHMTGGAAWNKGVFSIGPQVSYFGLGVSRSVLAEVGTPGGNAHVFSITAEPRLVLPFETLRPYIVGGVGYYRRTVNFTQPTLLPVTFFDPFFGFIPSAVPGNQVIGSVSHGGIGGNLGAGFSIPLGKTGVRLFTEARYHYANTGDVPTRMVPVTFGLRF